MMKLKEKKDKTTVESKDVEESIEFVLTKIDEVTSAMKAIWMKTQLSYAFLSFLLHKYFLILYCSQLLFSCMLFLLLPC